MATYKPWSNVIFYTCCLFVALVLIGVIRSRVSTTEKFAEQQPILSWTDLNSATGVTGRPVGISFGNDNTVACLNDTKVISVFTGSRWKTISGTFRRFALKDANNMVGVGQDFSVYVTTNAGTNSDWTRLAASRFENVSIGSDGSLWATTLPVGGAWSVYRYDMSSKNWVQLPGSMKQVSVFNTSNAWGLDNQGTPWMWDGKQWNQQSGQFSKISAGSEGSVWAIDNTGTISRLNREANAWQQIDGTFIDVSAKDASTIAVINSKGGVAVGSIASAGPVAMQQATPFIMSAYSGGSTKYSDYQKSAVAWAQLNVNGVSILDQTNSSNGYNVITLNGAGNVISLKSYDLKQSSAYGKQLAQDLLSLTAPNSAFTFPVSNLYGGYTGGQTSSPNFSVSITDHLLYTGQTEDGYYPATVGAGTYRLTFKYKGGGPFQLSQTGVDSGNLSDTLTGTSIWQTYSKQVIHTQAGLHKLSFKNQVVAQTEIEHPTLVAVTKTSIGRDISMILILTQGDLGSSNKDAVSAIRSMGSSAIDHVGGNSSYLMVYNAKTGNIINEQISLSGHVLFESNGPSPVLKATWSGADKTAIGVINIINQGVFVQYDTTSAAVKRSVNLKSSSLPAPFNAGVDAVFPMSDGKTYLMTRGKLWLTTTDLVALSVNNGPGVIGQGLLSGINKSPFLNGIQAMTPSPDNNAYIFSFGSYAKVTAGLTSILATGSLGAKGTEFASLPASFQKKIDSAFLAGSTLGLIVGEKLLYYDPQQAIVTNGPTSILSNPQFLGLPVSFKENSLTTVKPFFNQTVFPGNRIKNFDISTQVGQGLPGWDVSAFQMFNQNIAFNVVDPPVKVFEFVAMYPDITSTFGTNLNTLLKAFESNDGKWVGVPTYGGNVVSFTITDPSQTSFWLSYAKSTGTAFNSADLYPCEFYRLSLWARTNDPGGLTIGAETGTPTDNGVVLDGVQLKNGDGWQLLTWDFYNPSSSTAKDISFTLNQATNNPNILHSLYGPVLVSTAHLLADKLMTKLDETAYVYLNLGGRFLTFDGTSLSFLPTASSDSKFSVYYTAGSILITSSTRYSSDGQPLNVGTDGKICLMTSAQDSTARWVCLEDEDDSIYFVHGGTNTILQVGADGRAAVTDCKNAIDSHSSAAFTFSVDPPMQIKSTPQYVNAAFAQQSNVVLINRSIFTAYDTRQQVPVIYPTSLSNHSWFMNLPGKNTQISAALQQGTITCLFYGRTFCAWNLNSNSKDQNGCSLLLGPGGDDRFAKLPPPFSKGLTGAFNLDSSVVIFISGDAWLQWDSIKRAPITVGSMTTGASIFSGFEASLLGAGIDSCVENPNQMGTAYFFSSGEYILYDCLKRSTIDGPNTLGSPNTPFAGLTAPFIPSQADVCGLYLQNIKSNTDYPKLTCIDNPNRPYKWMSDCMFSDISCEAAGGIYNDIGGFCGSAISKGSTPLRNVDPVKRASNLASYMQACKPVSEYDYSTMRNTEQSKYDLLNRKLSQKKAENIKLASRVSAQQKNLQTLNAALQALRLELTNDDKQACHPKYICLKSTDTGGSKNVPLGCDQATVKAILAKNPMTDADLQALIQLIVKKGALNDYSIMQHPDYPNLVRTDVVTKCTPPTDKAITDFPLKDFPDFPKYIRKDQLLSAKQAVTALAAQSGKNSALPISPAEKQSVGKTSRGRTEIILPVNTKQIHPEKEETAMKCRHGRFSSIIRQALSGG